MRNRGSLMSLVISSLLMHFVLCSADATDGTHRYLSPQGRMAEAIQETLLNPMPSNERIAALARSNISQDIEDLRRAMNRTDVYKKSLQEGPFRIFQSCSKGGEAFYHTQDKRFIIKVVPGADLESILSLLPAYFEHLREHPKSLLARIVDLVAAPAPSSSYCIVMSNILHTSLGIEKTFDLKGATVRRTADPGHKVLKDVNFVKWLAKLTMQPTLTSSTMGVLGQDVEFLKKHGRFDYSLILGVHEVHDPTEANLTCSVLMSEDQVDQCNSRAIKPHRCAVLDFSGMPNSQCGDVSDERVHHIKYVLFLGIIDFFETFTFSRVLESKLKKCIVAMSGGETLPCGMEPGGPCALPPDEFAIRFQSFIRKTLVPDMAVDALKFPFE